MKFDRIGKRAFSVILGALMAISAVPAASMAEMSTASAVTYSGVSEMRGLNAFQIVNDMGAGWNLGNSLESSDSEINWGNPATTKAMIDDIAAEGFTTLRVPVRWDDHYSDASAYIIQTSYMDRVEEVVNYGLANGMYVILNVHHNDLQHNVPATEAISAELKAVWTQIGERFKNYGDKLIFEVNNEPRSGEDWVGNAELYQSVNECNEAARAAIRATGGNNVSRLVMLPTYCASGDEAKAAAWTKNADDDMIAASVHAYLPFNFAFQDDAKGGHSTWLDSDLSELQDFFKRLDRYFISKGVPVVLGEYGATNKNNTEEREKWAEAYTSLARQFGEQDIPCVIWDNNCYNVGPENFGLYNRSAGQIVYQGIVDVITDAYNGNPAYEVAQTTGGELVLSDGGTCDAWGQAVKLEASAVTNLYSDDVIICHYSSSVAPEFILQSFVNSDKSWVKITEPDSCSNGIAKWNVSTLISKFGGSLGELGMAYVGAGSSGLTVTKLYVDRPESHTHVYDGAEVITIQPTATTKGRKVVQCSVSGCHEKKVTVFENTSIKLNASAVAGDGKVTFTWDAVPNAERYSLSIYDPDTDKYTLRSSQITKTTYTTSGLTNGKEYVFLIRAYVNGAWSPYTSADFIKATPYSTKPSNITATAGDSKVKFTWTGVTGAERYSLSIYDPDTGKYTLRSSQITKTTYTTSKLTNGKEYVFLIRAYVNGAWSPYTSADFVKATPYSTKPANISATAGDGKVTFKWNSVPNAERYSLSIYNPDTGKYTLRSSQITKTTYTTSKLTNGEEYQFLIRAYVNGEWSPYTTADFVKVTPGTNKPTYISTTAGDGKVSFSWVGVADAERYSLSIYDPDTGKYTLRSSKITKTTYTTSSLTNGKEYVFLIRAYSNGAWSPYTSADFVKATPKA